MKDFNEDEAEAAHKEYSEKVEEKHLEPLLKKQKKIEDKFKSNDSIKDYLTKASSLFSLIKDYWNGDYREVPWKSIAAAAGALLYVLMPLDIIPDFIPIAGYLDDAGVIAACLNLINDDLVEYEKWKLAQDPVETEEI
ncbi:MAG TPA: YkvA family protein [Salinimicrobium sp.]|nr:YkvA family protein [Salinimicrobium sp.]